jgi:non-heme chloroperoxidase
MHRRELLVSAVTTGAFGVGLSAAAATAGASPRKQPVQIRTREGVGLFHREWGAGQPVLFVHSWALSSVIWRYQLGRLAEQGLRCITFDRRGHGRSDLPGWGYDMDTLADDLGTVIDTLDLRNVVLVGHSMGCGEIVRYIGRHGTGRVARVALIAPMTPFLTQTADNPYGAPAAYFEASWDEWQTDFPKWIEDNKLPAFTPQTSPQIMDWLAREMAQADLPAIIACSRASSATDLRPDLAKVDCPVLILQGDKDMSAPLDVTGRRTAAGIKQASLKVYPGAPHLLPVTHVKEVNADLLHFIKG